MQPETALRFARTLHRVVPFAQLRSANRIARLLNGKELTVATRLFGYDVLLDVHRSSVHRLLFIQGESFIEDVALIRKHVAREMTALDVGANIGYISLLLSRLVGETGRVYSFEPEADNFAELQRNVALNAITHCVPVNTAVGNRDGTIPFAPGLNGFVCNAATMTVPLVTLDSFVKQHGIRSVDFVKIDVEGFEGCVLDGMLGVIAKHHPTLYIEVHPKGYCGVGDPVAVANKLRLLYKNVKLFMAGSDISRLERWRSQLTGSRIKPVSIQYLNDHPESRYQALCTLS
jgi:FkbM family methyltransferase